MTTMKNTQTTDMAANTIFDFEMFVDALEYDEGNRRTGLSFMADLYNFFFWEDVLTSQELFEKNIVTDFTERHITTICEKREYVVSKMHYHGLKAIRTLLALNSHMREINGKYFVLKKLNKEDGLYDFRDVKEVFDAFENQFNQHHNPENIPGRNFADTNWKFVR